MRGAVAAVAFSIPVNTPGVKIINRSFSQPGLNPFDNPASAHAGVPDGFVQTCLLPVAYYTGDDFRPADRRPVSELTCLDHWGTPVGER